MTLRCVLSGHRRSRSRATFDEKRGQWISQCKRCHAMLVREADGTWQPLHVTAGKLVPVKRQPGGDPADKHIDEAA